LRATGHKLPKRAANVKRNIAIPLTDPFMDRIVLIGEASLHRAISQFLSHYHGERNHQGLSNKIIRPEFVEFPSEGAIHCRQRLGGLLRYYYREAA
jgi:hypothetical protein